MFLLELISELKNDYISKGVNLVNIAGGWTFRTADDLRIIYEFSPG